MMIAAAVAALACLGSAPQDKEKLKTLLKDEAVGDWIYDDFGAGLAKAKASRKPLLLVLRCVP